MKNDAAASKLDDLKEKLEEILDEIDDTVSKIEDEQTRTRAELYWASHLRGAIEEGHGAGSMFTMTDTINELYGVDEED